MAIATSSVFTEAYKYVYGPDGIRQQIVRRNPLLAQLQSRTGRTVIAGRSMLVPVQKADNQSYRGMAELQPTPEPGVPAFDEATVPINTIASTVRYSVQSKKTAQGSEHAFIEMQMKLMESTMQAFLQNWSRDLYADGTGAKAKISSGHTTTTLTLFASQASGTWTNYFGTDHLEEGMRVSHNTSTSGTAVDTDFDAVITDVDPDNEQVTVAGTTAGSAQNGYLFVGSSSRTSKGNVWMGMRGAYDDGGILATYLNIDKTAAGNRYWKGNVAAAPGAANLETTWRNFLQTIRKRSGRVPHMIYTTEGVANAYINQLKPDRRITMPLVGMGGGKFSYAGGADAIAFHFDNSTIPIVTDVDAPAGMAYFPNFDVSFLGYVPDGQPQWLDEEGEGIWKHIREYLAYEATLFTMGEFYTDQPNACGVMPGITEV